MPFLIVDPEGAALQIPVAAFGGNDMDTTEVGDRARMAGGQLHASVRALRREWHAETRPMLPAELATVRAALRAAPVVTVDGTWFDDGPLDVWPVLGTETPVGTGSHKTLTFTLYEAAATPAATGGEEGGGGEGCTPLLSGLAIGADFAMGLCDVTSIGDVVALSSQQADPLGNYWPTYTAGKRMSGAVGLTLVDDATSANGVRHLRLGAIPPGAPDLWQNGTIPFPVNTYPHFWTRFILRDIDPDTDFGLSSGADFFQGVTFVRSSSDSKIYVVDGAGSGIDTATPLTAAVSSSDLLEFAYHVHGLSTTDTPGSPNTRSYDATWDLYVRNRTTNVTTSILGTAVSVQGHPVSNNNANPYGDWLLALLNQIEGGTTQVHAWEFVDGSAHTNPFGY